MASCQARDFDSAGLPVVIVVALAGEGGGSPTVNAARASRAPTEVKAKR